MVLKLGLGVVGLGVRDSIMSMNVLTKIEVQESVCAHVSPACERSHTILLYFHIFSCCATWSFSACVSGITSTLPLALWPTSKSGKTAIRALLNIAATL